MNGIVSWAATFRRFSGRPLADLRVAGMDANLREAGTAVVLDELIRRNHKIDLWAALDELLELYVGRTDALSFREMETSVPPPA